MTCIEYLPMESVMVPLPDVVTTLTDSSGMEREASYTVPLILDCDMAEVNINSDMHVAKILMKACKISSSADFRLRCCSV